MKKRIIAVLLTMLLVMSASVMGVSAEIYYDIFVGEVMVTSANANDVLGDGTVSFDFETNTLTLENANIEGDSLEGMGTGIYAYGTDLIIELVGENNITVENPENNVNTGIYALSGKLTVRSIEGGRLTINAGDSKDEACGINTSAGMHNEEGFLMLEDANITINCGDAEYSKGISAEGPMYISGGSLSIETGEAEVACGIETTLHYVYDQDTTELITVNVGHLSVTDNAKVKITAEKAELTAYGIHSSGDITIDGAEIDTVVSAGHGDAEDSTSDKVFPEGRVYAINACGNLIFKSSKVTVLAKNGGGNIVNASTREYIDQATGETVKTLGNIEIHEGADIYIKTADSDYNRFAMSSSYDITVYAGKVTIEMGELTGNFVVRRMYGMYADHFARFNGGITTISVPEDTEEYDDFSCVSSWYGGIYLSDDMTISGRKGNFFNGVGACVQIDPEVPVVIRSKASVPFDSGDVNRDNVVNIKDATSIQKYLAGLENFDEEQKFLADFNGDENINIKDATAIQKKIAGLI